ncbi:hypothetical protein GO491_07165 [Flavobacteriaceae bacterium Ap0902]|nr:hypothetical protein [Flavobacteriaceae bacterium Ap0902]
MKIKLSFTFLLAFSLIFSQTRTEFEEIAFEFGEIINDACSSASKDLDISIDWESFDTNYITESAEAKIKISWVGSWTGSFYWIKGKLVLDGTQRKILWYKYYDSGGFPSNCSLKVEREYPDIVIVK